MNADERTERMQRRFEIPVVIAALMVIPSMLLGRSGTDALQTTAFILDTLIWLVFAAELIAILAVTPHKWRWMRDNPLEPIIVIFTRRSRRPAFARLSCSGCSASCDCSGWHRSRGASPRVRASVSPPSWHS